MILKKIKPEISVLGCGWLGLPLAQKLQLKNFNVKGSTTSSDKIPVLTSLNIQPFLLDLNHDISNESIFKFFNSDILIICFPPGRNKDHTRSYIEKIKLISSIVSESKIKKIIYTSSTSVYSDEEGIYDEFSSKLSDSKSGQDMLEAENILKSIPSIDLIILRLAGLINQERNLAKSISKRVELPNGEASTNFVHLIDVVNIIVNIIENDICNKTYNICSSDHPNRIEFYQYACEKLGINKLNFPLNGKFERIISNELIKKEMGYQFIIDNPLQGLEY